MIKRKHKRFPITGTATVQFEDEGKNKTIPAILSSISTVGMGLYTNNPIEANKQVSVTINFISTDGIEDSVIEGSVVFNRPPLALRCGSSKSSSGVATGAKGIPASSHNVRI